MPDDYTADITTTGTVTVGGTATGELETSGDEDWFAVTLTAGQIVSISLDGISLSDPYLNIYDSAGNFLFSNDDGGPGLNSFLTFEVTVGGTFYIGARAFSTQIGTYQVSVEVTAISSPTTNPLLEDIDWGTQVVSNTINVFFAPSGYAADGYTSEGFNAYEMAQFQTVFNLFESIADLHFNIVTSDANADFILVLDTNEIGGAFLGYFNPPGTSGAGIGVFDGASWDRSAGGDLERGGNGFYTIIHELGHGLGLAHPHDGRAGSAGPQPGALFSHYNGHVSSGAVRPRRHAAMAGGCVVAHGASVECAGAQRAVWGRCLSGLGCVDFSERTGPSCMGATQWRTGGCGHCRPLSAPAGTVRQLGSLHAGR